MAKRISLEIFRTSSSSIFLQEWYSKRNITEKIPLFIRLIIGNLILIEYLFYIEWFKYYIDYYLSDNFKYYYNYKYPFKLAISSDIYHEMFNTSEKEKKFKRGQIRRLE